MIGNKNAPLSSPASVGNEGGNILFPIMPHNMEDMIVCKFVKSRIAIAVFVAWTLVPLSGYAGIGAEPSNRPADPNAYAADSDSYAADPMMAQIPPYPGTTSGTDGQFVPPAQMYMQPSAQYTQPYPGTFSATGGQWTAPSSMYAQPPQGNAQYPNYGNVPTYGNVPGMPAPYGDQSRTIYPYPTAGNSAPYPQYPSYPNTAAPAAYPGASQVPWQQPAADYAYPGQAPYGSADQSYNIALQAYRRGDYWTAMAKFQEVATNYPQSDLVDNAYYWMGEIQYSGKNFPAAIQLFQMVIYSYPNGNKAPDAFVKMGYAYAELRQYATAKAVLNDVIARYSNNKRIRDVAMRKFNEIKNLY